VAENVDATPDFQNLAKKVLMHDIKSESFALFVLTQLQNRKTFAKKELMHDIKSELFAL